MRTSVDDYNARSSPTLTLRASSLDLELTLGKDGEPVLGLLLHGGRRAGARLGPLAHGGDALLHGDSQRHDLAQRRQQAVGGEIAAGVEGVVERADDRLLDLGAG